MKTGIGFTDKNTCKMEKANDGLKVTRLSMAASLNPGRSISPSPLLCVCFTDPHSQESGQGLLGIQEGWMQRGRTAGGGRSTVGEMEEQGCHDSELYESLATSP